MRRFALPVLLGLTLSGVAYAAASVNIASMDVDGVRIRDLSCELSSGGGIMGGMVVASTLAGQKTALDACAPEGGAFKAEWTWTEGSTKVDKVTGVPEKGAACVKEALGPMQSASTGTCTAVVLIGPNEVAEAHYKTLKGEPATPPDEPHEAPAE
ncbi:MAG: hypothetical protein VX899_03200 [Myxococcota bacterium]|nr:hypothetical protein [Myxococcota bacterium]